MYTCNYNAAFLPMSEIFRQNVAEAGVQLNVIVGPSSEYWGNVWLKQPFLTSKLDAAACHAGAPIRLPV